MENKTERICNGLDAFVKSLGRIFMWSNGLLLMVIIVQVVLRYVFKSGFIALEELQWHLYALGIMTGISCAMERDVHIRVDVISSRLSGRTRQMFELAGILFLLLPFLVIIFHQSLDFVHEAWRTGERSVSPMGLPFRWLVKSLIPFGFGLMILTTVSRMIRTANALIGGKHHGAQ
ncbi:MAG: TRAP transporter small permease subunit [Pseudomonadota bacterium]